ncbi:DUF3455 domain-containing protein [Caldimonas brevitalea]|uniref:DUF3455 domain-containing protein n=1 Tax=Caldimonas brevitalea TaxID=413882 RepID=A0A0G3BNQ7_9BURK|nr:DUF3455 domain-containing protein [Caldimonas brevitalea]AKJ29623.1 hypothetical protein AAW51_2932 [Caldimonas brevitalea]
MKSALIALAPVVLLAACATPSAPHQQVPPQLKPPAGSKLTLESPAEGVQIYTCGPSKTDPARHEWVFKAPEAELFDTSGKRIGKHYGGPTWESADGSKVVAAVAARDDGPDAAAIPWLLLKSTSNAGQGTFASTSYIQRVATVGGKAPTDACDAARAGTERRVPYRATYYFFAG